MYLSSRSCGSTRDTGFSPEPPAPPGIRARLDRVIHHCIPRPDLLLAAGRVRASAGALRRCGPRLLSRLWHTPVGCWEYPPRSGYAVVGLAVTPRVYPCLVG